MSKRNKSTFYVDEDFPQYVIEENEDEPVKVYKEVKPYFAKHRGSYHFLMYDKSGRKRCISETRIGFATENKKPIVQSHSRKPSKLTLRASNRTYLLQLMEEKQALQEQYPRLRPYLDEAILFLEKRKRSRYANLRYLIVKAAADAKIKAQKRRLTLRDNDTNTEME